MKIIERLLILAGLIGLGLSASGQSSMNLSASEIFEKVIHHYDPEGIWDQFEGSIHMYTIIDGNIGEEDLTINNNTGYYRSIKYYNDSTFVKGMKDGQLFFEVNGRKMSESEVPARFHQGPYSLTANSVKTMLDHHKLHFSIPLLLDARGAKPLSEVGQKSLFGVDCLAIRFSGLPDNYPEGIYNGEITLYINPADNYKLRAVHFANGMWTNEEGFINLLEGEIEVQGLIIPQQRLYFDAANMNYRFLDVFTPETRFE